ncbi:MAG: SAM-dependent DNA methyltransferase [Clostridia bacterium]|nr:SAM-dependent DNA methyltransferase [Clostridia bacterium]
MAKNYNYNVMLDDNSIDVSKEVGLVWSIANSLRGAYTSDKYKDVIIPMVIIRRFECALAATKQAVIEKHEKSPTTPAALLEQISGYPFYNTSKFTLKKLLNDSDGIAENFKSYIDGFSANVQTIINNLEFKKQIDKLDKNNRLYGIVKKFSDIDFDPTNIDGMKMGYIFEDIIRRFSENAEAGDHYTPREVIRLLVNVLLAEGCNDLLTEEGKVATVLDAACGSGGMLSTTHDFLVRKNPYVDVRLFGQEINPESYAICMADMLIKGEDARNIKGGDPANTLKTDCFPNQKMRLVIMNPPFGTPWGGKDAPDGQEKAVRDEYKKGGRFEKGLPASGDAQLLFMQHIINKMDDKNGRAAIISNGSPLFSGGTTSGESQIRRWMLEEDLVEAIIALPSQLFYNTDIGIYAFILSKNKRPDRKGKVQLINAVNMWKPLRKSLGKKRREIDRDSMLKITELYANFEETPESKIFDNEEFVYREYSVWQPLQRRGTLSREAVEELKNSTLFTGNSNIFNLADFEQLEEMNPRSAADEKKYQKYIKGRQFVADVIAILENNTSDAVYMDFSEFEKHLKGLLYNVEGLSASRLTGIAMALSVMDKAAVIQKDKKGNVIVDTTTKDSEIIKLTKDPKEYFDEEVYPHVPDAIWKYEYDPTKKEGPSNKEKQGAEFPFTRFFYEYKAPESADDLLAQFMELEKSLAEKIASL